MASHSTSPYSRSRLSAALTTTQHVSALVFGSFLFVHLAAPAVAAVAPKGGALDLSTKTMILGRVYYQNALTEPLVVYGAATVHVLAGVAKRLIALEYKVSRRQRTKPSKVEGYSIPDADADDEAVDVTTRRTSTWQQIYRNLPSIHTITGVALLPAITIHALLNRIAPSTSDAPIRELSPSELDYSYVTYGLTRQSGVSQAWHRITIALYGVLLVAGAVHVVAGTDRIAQRARARAQVRKLKAEGSLPQVVEPSATSARRAVKMEDFKRKQQRKAIGTAAVSAAGVLWLTQGLVRMSSETSGVSGYLAKRVQACYARVWPYSLWA